MKAEDREKLLEQVTDLVLMGYTYVKVASKLNISVKTVSRYVMKNRKRIMEGLRGNPEEQIAELQLAKNKRIKKLWSIVLDKNSSKGNVTRSIQLLQNEEGMEIKRKQLIGLLPPDNPTIAIQNNNTITGTHTIADSIRENYPELLEKFIHNKSRLISTKEEDTKEKQ